MEEDDSQVAEAVAESVPPEEAAKKKKKKKKKNKPTIVVLQSQNLVEASFPWRAKNLPVRGRCAVSTRQIKAGEVIVAEKAVAFVPREKHLKAICHTCGKELAESAPRVECSSCNYSVFCKECDEQAHQRLCKLYADISSMAKRANCDADLLRFVLNLSLQQTEAKAAENGEGKLVNEVIHSSFQDATGLKTHREKAPAAWREAVRYGCQLLHDAANTGDDPIFTSTVDDLEILAALVNTNAHGMGAQGVHNTDIALGIFPFVSMLNHSCRPNCCFASEGCVMYVRAIQDIPTGEELCVSYINLYEPRNLRQRQLEATKYFNCRCSRCSEPLASSIDRFLEGCICQVKGCGGVVIRSSSLRKDGAALTTWECDLCSRILDPSSSSSSCSSSSIGKSKAPWEIVSAAERKLVAAVGVYSERRFPEALKMLQEYITEYSGKLHQLHVLLFDALTPLMNCCRALGDAEEGIRVCKSILGCMEKVLVGPSLELGNFYFCLGEMHLERTQSPSISPLLAKRSMKQAQEAFVRVRNIREICLGKSSLPS